MKVQQGADYFIDYHKANSKKYVRNQVFVLTGSWTNLVTGRKMLSGHLEKSINE